MAHAWTPPPADDAARLAQYLPVARAAWPQSPCAGREVIHLHADADLASQAPTLTGSSDGALDGMAAPSTCEVWMASSLTALTFCTVLVHEMGHLAGRLHNDHPGDIMNGDGDLHWGPCQRLTTPPASIAVLQELRAALPAPRAAWRISCGAPRATGRRCVARRGTAIRRYRVSQARNSVSVVPLAA